jgi:hypothetical protein
MQYGFSSYTRFYKACLVTYSCTPVQLELRLIESLLHPIPEQDSGAPVAVPTEPVNIL